MLSNLPCTSFIEAEWAAPPQVNALVTTRAGGTSRPPFDYFNMGLHVGDDKENVINNRKKLVADANLPNEPVWLNQTHSNKLVRLDDQPLSSIQQSDGAITEYPGVVCAVMTADCLPLFLCDNSGEQVAVVHVGWRGMAAGIIEKTIANFNQGPEKILAWAGPCINVDHFEVGVDVRDQLGGSDEAYKLSDNSGKYYANLYMLTEQRLLKAGVKNYQHSNYCTFRDKSLFYSYRRQNQTGRMASLIWIEEH